MRVKCYLIFLFSLSQSHLVYCAQKVLPSTWLFKNEEEGTQKEKIETTHFVFCISKKKIPGQKQPMTQHEELGIITEIAPCDPEGNKDKAIGK